MVLTLSGCALFGGDDTDGIKVQVDQDVQITNGQNPKTKVGKGKSFVITSEPAMIESPLFVSVYVVPIVGEARGELKLKLQPTPQGAAGLTASNRQEIKRAIETVGRAHTLIAEQKGKDASDLIGLLRAEYPDTIYLDLLYASCLVLANETPRAAQILQNILKLHPERKDIEESLKQIQGGSR